MEVLVALSKMENNRLVRGSDRGKAGRCHVLAPINQFGGLDDKKH